MTQAPVEIERNDPGAVGGRLVSLPPGVTDRP